MIETTVVIVGGGPAGSACAWRLNRAGIDAIILDKSPFPRTKLCAGWITPNVFRRLATTPEKYPHGLLTFDRLICHFRGRRVSVKTRQYSIRRYEFDQWMIQRAGVPVHTHQVTAIQKDNAGYCIDGKYRCEYLIGAGGTHCPVYRKFFANLHLRPQKSLITAVEAEFPFSWIDSNCYLWFFENGLPGYAWYVPKGNGYLNLGIGGKWASMKKRGENIKTHWNRFIEKLLTESLIPDQTLHPRGYAYYLRGRDKNVRHRNAFLVGDAAGLATLDMGEGIGPAVASGLRAAEAIIFNKPYTLSGISRYSLLNILMPWMPF